MKCTECGCTVMIFDFSREGWYQCECCGTEFIEDEEGNLTKIVGE